MPDRRLNTILGCLNFQLLFHMKSTGKAHIHAWFLQYSQKVDALLNELHRFNTPQLQHKPSVHSWSAIQTLLHLVLVEEQSLAYIHKKLSFNPKLEDTGLFSSLKGLLLWLLLTSPIKFKAPQMSSHQNIPNDITLDQIRNRWEQSQKSWQDFIAQMPENLIKKAVYRHPRAGRIGWQTTFYFFRIHLKRHRKQIFRAIGQMV